MLAPKFQKLSTTNFDGGLLLANEKQSTFIRESNNLQKVPPIPAIESCNTIYYKILPSSMQAKLIE